MGQNQREAVAAWKHKPSSYSMVWHFRSGPGPCMPGSVGRQSDQPWGPKPRGIHHCVRFLELVMWTRTGFPLRQEPHAWSFMSQRPNWSRHIFFKMQTHQKLGKYSDHLMDRITSSAQNLMCFRLCTRHIQSVVTNISQSWYNLFQSYNEGKKKLNIPRQ